MHYGNYGYRPTGNTMDTTTQTLLFFIGLTLGVITVAATIGLVVAQSLDAEDTKRRSVD